MRDSLHLGLAQLGPKIRRWKWLFALAAGLLLAVLAGLAYVWVRDNTELLPQRETEVTPIAVSKREEQIASALGAMRIALNMYDVLLADDFKGFSIQAELWTHQGMEQSWELAKSSADERDIFGPRRQSLILSTDPRSSGDGAQEKYWIDYGIDFANFSTSGQLKDIPDQYMRGGVVWKPDHGHQIVDRGEGAVLLTLSIGDLSEGVFAPAGLPPEHDGAVYLVFRLYCE